MSLWIFSFIKAKFHILYLGDTPTWCNHKLQKNLSRERGGKGGNYMKGPVSQLFHLSSSSSIYHLLVSILPMHSKTYFPYRKFRLSRDRQQKDWNLSARDFSPKDKYPFTVFQSDKQNVCYYIWSCLLHTEHIVHYQETLILER